MDRGEVLDVDAELHGRRAKQRGEPAGAERLLALDPILGRDLPGVLGREQPGERRRPFRVEPREIRVRRRSDQLVPAQMQRLGPHRIGRRRPPVAAAPAQGVHHQLHAPGLAASLDHRQQMPPQRLDDREHEGLGLLGTEIVVDPPGAPGAQVASDARAHTEAQPDRAVAGVRAGAGQQRDLALAQPLALVEGPRLAQALGDPVGERARPLLGQRRGVEHEHPAQMVGDRPQHRLTPFRRRPGDGRRARPQRLVGRELGEAMVVDAQEPALLEVRLGNPPGPGQILERPVLEEIDHGAPGVLVPRAAPDRLLHEQLGREAERAEHGAAELVESQLAPSPRAPARARRAAAPPGRSRSCAPPEGRRPGGCR